MAEADRSVMGSGFGMLSNNSIIPCSFLSEIRNEIRGNFPEILNLFYRDRNHYRVYEVYKIYNFHSGLSTLINKQWKLGRWLSDRWLAEQAGSPEFNAWHLPQPKNKTKI